MKFENMIFVGGAERTGTTILQRTLCSSIPGAPMLSECNFLRRQVEIAQSAKSDFEFHHKDYFGTLENLHRFAKRVIEDLLSLMASNHGTPSSIILKDPALTGYFPVLSKWFPEAKFVIMVRDPRDTIASVVKVIERKREMGVRTVVTELGRDMNKHTRRFNGYYQPVISQSSYLKGQAISLRYEGFVSRDQSTIDRVERFLGLRLKFDPLPAEPTEAQATYFDKDVRARHETATAYWSDLYLSDVSKSRVGRFSETLTEQEVRTVMEGCKGFNRHFKYW